MLRSLGLLIHNFLCPQRTYQLNGFYSENNVFHAVVRQPYVEITEPTDTAAVKEFLVQMAFGLERTMTINPDAGIILEGLHDENILINKGVLFFIDTTFYLMPSFF